MEIEVNSHFENFLKFNLPRTGLGIFCQKVALKKSLFGKNLTPTGIKFKGCLSFFWEV